jgi:hypothetical protein
MRVLGKCKYRLKDNTELFFEVIGCESAYWIQLAKNSKQTLGFYEIRCFFECLYVCQLLNKESTSLSL